MRQRHIRTPPKGMIIRCVCERREVIQENDPQTPHAAPFSTKQRRHMPAFS
ncbi:MAG: hypothetical protein RI911_231, partial [Candidatus Parcubacteria bacterium]